MHMDMWESLKISFAYDLIYGNITHAKEVWDKAQQLNLQSVPTTALLVKIDDYYLLTENKSKMFEHHIQTDVLNAIYDYLREIENETLAIRTAADHLAVLLSIPIEINQDETKKKAMAYAERLKDTVKRRTGYSVSVGIGNHYEDARNVHLSYEEALQALKYKFFTGSNVCIHINDVDPFESDNAFLTGDIASTLSNKLIIGDEGGMLQWIRLFLNELKAGKHVEPDMVKLKMFDLLTVLARASIEANVTPSSVYRTHLQCVTELNFIENLQKLEEWTFRTVNRFLTLVVHRHSEYRLEAIRKATRYIQDHYNKNISLEEVANHVYLSPNYFSGMFKKTVGCSFVEYITRLRINKAKHLLADLSYSVHQIAREVGYSDARYFSRVFKAAIGKSPTEYRNCMLKQVDKASTNL